MNFDFWHIVISGFLQHDGQPHGCVALWNRLRTLSDCSTQQVERMAWNDDVAALAEFIHRLRPDLAGHDRQRAPLVNLYGYSWGGMTAVKLARALQRHGIEVPTLVLSDAVYRHWYWLGNWRAFVPWRKIVVPSNVKRVVWFVQRENWPRGHRLVAANPRTTKIEPPIGLGLRHTDMDDAAAFHRAALEAAGITAAGVAA